MQRWSRFEQSSDAPYFETYLSSQAFFTFVTTLASNFPVLWKHLRISRNTLLLLSSRNLNISRNKLYIWNLQITHFKMIYDTSIFYKVPRTFTWLVYWRHGVTRDCKWSTMILQVVSLIRPSSRKQHGTKNNKVMVEHLQSGDQTMAPEDSAWQAMPHVCEIGCMFVF